jgi:CPA2 family monovalent cation:H+ antiporter-2
MHSTPFLQDLAVLMIVAGATTVLMHALRQPVVLGYIIAGLIIGPHTPPYPLITDSVTIATLAELGVVFLMFSLGIEFDLRKLKAVGVTATVAALAEIVLMIWVGYEIGRFFGWPTMDAVFLGAMLSISSTTIIIKALAELGKTKERFAQLIFGILIVEDVLAIAIIALLSSVSVGGDFEVAVVGATLGKLGVFIVVSLVVGLVTVPRVLDYVARFRSDEMLLVAALGLCFGFSLLVVKLGYSVALGAFLVGVIVSEGRQKHEVERLIEPVRDMFSAVFFVSVGLLLDPRVLVDYAMPIAVITVAVIVGKVATCSLGTFLSGNDGRTSLHVGMGLAQIGEFSFIIAALGASRGVTSDFLYPIAVAVSAVTTLLTPYLIRGTPRVADVIERAAPESSARLLALYSDWLGGLRSSGNRTALARAVRRIFWHVAINTTIVVGLFLAGSYLAGAGARWLPGGIAGAVTRNTILWSAALVASTPFLVAIYRKLDALSLMLADVSVPDRGSGVRSASVRRLVSRVIPLASLAALGLLLVALSSAILPPLEVLAVSVTLATAIAIVFRRSMVRLHARLQVALIESMSQSDSHGESR